MVPEESSRFGNSRLSLGEDGILRQSFSPGAVVTGRESRLCLDAKRRLVGDTPWPLLVDLRKVRTIERDARVCYTGPEFSRHARAVALLADSPMTQMIGNFIITPSRPVYPARLFNEEDVALDWLRGFRS